MSYPASDPAGTLTTPSFNSPRAAVAVPTVNVGCVSACAPRADCATSTGTSTWGPASAGASPWGPDSDERSTWGPASDRATPWGPASAERSTWGPASDERSTWGPALAGPEADAAPIAAAAAIAI